MHRLSDCRWRRISVFVLFLAAPLDAAPPELELRTRNVVLVTVDGLRHQELFTGVDPLMLDNKERSGINDVDRLRAAYWRETPEARREALFPFFWKTLASQGIVLGNRQKGSRVTLTNPHHVSFPGYAELLTGQAQPEVTGNAAVQIPRQTLLEFVRRKLELDKTKVAAFASWRIFRYITAHEAGDIFTNAGYEKVPDHVVTPGMVVFNELQMQMLTPWDTVRHDSITAGLALEYIKEYKPRLLYVALGETDDWAHDRRYDRVIHASRLFDDTLRKLWNVLQSMDVYRNRTTLVITTDHGRGSTLDDWTSHGAAVEGAEDIWIAIIGPDTPDQGEVAPSATFHLSNVAGTVLEFFALRVHELNPQAGEAIPLAFSQP